MTTLTAILRSLASVVLAFDSPLLSLILDTPLQATTTRRTRTTARPSKADDHARVMAEMRAARAVTERRLAELSV